MKGNYGVGSFGIAAKESVMFVLSMKHEWHSTNSFSHLVCLACVSLVSLERVNDVKIFLGYDIYFLLFI